MNETITLEPLRGLRAHLSAACWARRVERAHYRLAVVEAIKCQSPASQLTRAGARAVAPKAPWSTIRRWWQWYHRREGLPWERMMDWRRPQRPWETPPAWKSSVRVFAHQHPPPSFASIREALVAEFGPQAALGHTTLRRILQEAGRKCPGSRPPEPVEEVTELSGGGGLVLLLAAAHESGELRQMATAVVEWAQAQVAPAAAVPAEPVGRDERGRFTAAYNRHRLASRGEEGLYQSVADQREHKDLRRLRLASLSAETLEHPLRCLVVLPLITTRRGVMGLDDPAGAWLKILSPVAYRAATLEKTLNELKWLDAAQTLWDSHARTWLTWSTQWAGEGWPPAVYSVDASQDPWWTQRFAKSGQVSRTGRVQPCLSRTVLSSGPGVPIIAEVVSGQADLGEPLFRLMNRADAIVGPSAITRLTIVDAACCHRAILERFQKDPHHDVVSVLKGPLATGKMLEPRGEWIAYRERDPLRETVVNLEPKQAEGLKLRGVEMRRPASRAPHPTGFITTASPQLLSTTEVADAYLSRWPFQEDLFRRGRNGIGLERSHGYGVSKVANLAVIGKRDVAARHQQQAEQALLQAMAAEVQASEQLLGSWERFEQQLQTCPAINGRHELGVRQAQQRLKRREQDRQQAQKTKQKADQQVQTLASIPDEIAVRDTALDAITTCLKMALLALLEFICQEYLGHYRLMPRTFIEAWMPLPVIIRRSRHRLLFEVAPNPRDPPMTGLLDEALKRITARKLRVDGRLLVARVRDGP